MLSEQSSTEIKIATTEFYLYLSLNFIIQELFLELGESVVATVVIQVERIQHIPAGGENGYNKVLIHKQNLSLSQGVVSYSIMEGSLVSRMWSVRIHGIDISMGNWIRRPMVSSRKNSLNHSWDRSQHCCRASEQRKDIRRDQKMKECLQIYRHIISFSQEGLSSDLLTAEVEQVCEEEGMFVEVLNGHYYWSIQTAAESLLRPTLICDQWLQHGAHHVQLHREGKGKKI